MSKDRILIVDDNPHNTAIVQRILGDGYDVVDAETGEEALAIAETFVPDIVLLDIMLPGVDGYEVCERVKAHPDLPNTKIIMVTAKAMMSEKLRGYGAGADDYVTKPFDGEELLAKVRVYLRLKTIEEHESLKSQLLTLLGHEARTPLTYVKASAQNLANSDGLGERERGLAEIIDDGVSRISDLLTKVLRYGELKSFSSTTSLVPTDVGLVVDGMVANLSGKAQARNVKIVRYGSECAEVMADEPSLSEALGIVLSNAIRFGSSGGTVDVTVLEEDPSVTITIRDNGPGIAREVLPTLFYGFRTPDLDHHSRGHGLNLAIARAIVETHGGQLGADSEVGSGTTISLRLPACKERAQLETPRAIQCPTEPQETG